MKELGAIILAILQIGLIVLSEVFSGKAREREEQEKHDKMMEEQFKLIQAHVTKIRDRAKKESSQAQDIEDQREEDMRNDS